MFLGHYALAMASKRSAPRASLGALVAAAQLPDLLWPIFLLLGWERVEAGGRGFLALSFTHYPWSHSLAMDVLWALLAGMGYALVTRDRRGAVVIALLVVSHWVLDYVTHQPDLPLTPGGSARVGLGLWRSSVATVIVEGVLSIAGYLMYVRGTRPTDRIGRYALWALAALLVALYATNLVSEPPPSMRAVAWGALGGLIVPIWAWWVDRHRVASVSDERR